MIFPNIILCFYNNSCYYFFDSSKGSMKKEPCQPSTPNNLHDAGLILNGAGHHHFIQM